MVKQRQYEIRYCVLKDLASTLREQGFQSVWEMMAVSEKSRTGARTLVYFVDEVEDLPVEIYSALKRCEGYAIFATSGFLHRPRRAP